MPAMIDTGYDYVTANGKRYAITRRNGLFFIYDPRGELAAERQSVLDFMNAGQRQASGLAGAEQAAIQVASTAANFIPGVGSIISAGIQLLGGLFGGGDPTALSILIDQIVQLREQIAEANKVLGNPDTFTVPAGFDAKDKDTWRTFVDAIVEQALSVTADDIQQNRRADYYKTIDALKKIAADVKQQAEEANLARVVEQQIAAVQGAAATATPATSSTSAGTLGSLAPWLIAGGLAAYVMLEKRR